MRDECRKCKYRSPDIYAPWSISYCLYGNWGISHDLGGTAYINEVSGGECPKEKYGPNGDDDE